MVQTRMTKQRSIILRVLRSLDTHPTADEIYGIVRSELPRISLGTVYRNLEMLTEMGEICRLDRAGAQKRFDGDLRPHLHVRCEQCGKIGDIHDSIEMPPLEGITAEGFTLNSVEVAFSGKCKECQLQ